MSLPEKVSELIKQGQQRFGKKGFAQKISKNPRTVNRWLSGESPLDPALLPALEKIVRTDINLEKESCDFTFIDLFAGIGGMRKGFESQGGKCIFTSEWDFYSRKTYEANFPPINGHTFFADDLNKITKSIDEIKNKIPKHDVLLAGFPCQPFSIAGVSKKNSLGRAHGFDCIEQGNLFFCIHKILKERQPVAFLLENVKNLKSHDKGQTFKVICEKLENLGYKLGINLHYKIIDAQGFVPQHRERIFLVGFKKETGFSWDDFVQPAPDSIKMGHILSKNPVPEKYTLSDKLWKYLQDYSARHKAKGNGFGFGLVYPDSISRTISARYYKDGSEILVYRGNKKNPRRLTPPECALLMGYNENFFEKGFEIPVSDTRAYKQFGNSVVVPVVAEIARIMKPHILALKTKD